MLDLEKSGAILSILDFVECFVFSGRCLHISTKYDFPIFCNTPFTIMLIKLNVLTIERQMSKFLKNYKDRRYHKT